MVGKQTKLGVGRHMERRFRKSFSGEITLKLFDKMGKTSPGSSSEEWCCRQKTGMYRAQGPEGVVCPGGSM